MYYTNISDYEAIIAHKKKPGSYAGGDELIDCQSHMRKTNSLSVGCTTEVCK